VTMIRVYQIRRYMSLIIIGISRVYLFLNVYIELM